jgi:hypothetical protein
MASLYINGPRTHTGNRRLSPLAGLESSSIQGLWAHHWWSVGLGGGREWPVENQIQEGGRRRCGIPPEQPRSRKQRSDLEKSNCRPSSARLNDMQMSLFSDLPPRWVVLGPLYRLVHAPYVCP